MAEVRSTSAAPVAWDSLARDGMGKPHGEVEGKPISSDALDGGSAAPTIKGEWKSNGNGVG